MFLQWKLAAFFINTATHINERRRKNWKTGATGSVRCDGWSKVQDNIATEASKLCANNTSEYTGSGSFLSKNKKIKKVECAEMDTCVTIGGAYGLDICSWWRLTLYSVTSPLTSLSCGVSQLTLSEDKDTGDTWGEGMYSGTVEQHKKNHQNNKTVS